MKVVVGFFGTMLVFILIATVLRAILRRLMKDADKAQNIACMVALIPTMVFAWCGYGLVPMMIVLVYVGGVMICDYFDKKNMADTSDASKM